MGIWKWEFSLEFFIYDDEDAQGYNCNQLTKVASTQSNFVFIFLSFTKAFLFQHRI